jgi:hypothetical protein
MLLLGTGSLEGRGHQPLGEYARACFCMIMSISAFFAYYAHVVGSWMCAQRHARDHLA